MRHELYCLDCLFHWEMHEPGCAKKLAAAVSKNGRCPKCYGKRVVTYYAALWLLMECA